MTDQHIEEELSISYVSAVVAFAGRSYQTIARDYGVDGAIRQIDQYNGKFIDIGTIFECQLKATINWSEKGNEILYDMEADAYNKLIYKNSKSTVPCILILLCLPKDKAKWLQVDPHQLAIKECCYYQKIEGDPTVNTSKVRVKISKDNKFNQSGIETLIADLESN
jgi:hypothetical protein